MKKVNFIALARTFGVKALAGLTGIQGWLANIILNKLWNALKVAWAKALVKIGTAKEMKEELEKYEKIINKPDATAEEIRNAAPDFLG